MNKTNIFMSLTDEYDFMENALASEHCPFTLDYNYLITPKTKNTSILSKISKQLSETCDTMTEAEIDGNASFLCTSSCSTILWDFCCDISGVYNIEVEMFFADYITFEDSEGSIIGDLFAEGDRVEKDLFMDRDRLLHLLAL